MVKQEIMLPSRRALPFEQYRELKLKNYKHHRKQLVRTIKLDKMQVKKAAEVLSAIVKPRAAQDVLDVDDEFIYAEIELSKVLQEFSFRPIQVGVPHPIHVSERGLQTCIVVAEPSSNFKERLEQIDCKDVFSKVIGVDKFLKHFKLHRQKAELVNNYDLFFCDWRVYNLLKDHAGKIFVERKKVPFPIDCEEIPSYLPQFTHYKDYLKDLLNHTYVSTGHGPVYTIKVGRISMTLREKVKNFINGVINFLPHVVGEQGSRVRRVSIKCTRSISLPVFCQLTGKEIEAMRE